MKTLLFTIAWLLVIAISGTTGWMLKAVQPRPVPTIRDIQEMVGCEKIDGILGKETEEKWNKVICQQYADVWNFYYED